MVAPALPIASVPTGTRGHLHDREQRVEALERVALHRHAQHRQRRLGRNHAWQMGGAAGARDDDLQPAAFGLTGVVGHFVRRAMRGDDPALVRDTELRQHLVGVLQRLPVRLAAHDHANHCWCVAHALIIATESRRCHRRPGRAFSPVCQTRRTSLRGLSHYRRPEHGIASGRSRLFCALLSLWPRPN